jgi:hypothetical protein
MAAIQGKRYRFDQDPEAARRAEDIQVHQVRQRPLTRKIKRTLTLGLTLAVPLFVFLLYHPSKSVNPIESATAAVASGTLDAEQPTLITNGGRLKSLQQIEANVDAGSGEVRELYGSGAIAGVDPTLRLEFRSRMPNGKAPGFSNALAESMAKMTVVVRKMGAQQSLTTSRGPIEWADLVISTSTGPKSCLAFRATPTNDKRMTGMLCGVDGTRPDLAALSCVIDRLELTKGAIDAGFDGLLPGPAATRGLCRGAIL